MKDFIPLEVPGFPGFYYTDCADNLAVNLDGDVLYLVRACVKKNVYMQSGLDQKVDTVRLGVCNKRKIKTLIYCAMFGEPDIGRITGAFILEGVSQIRTPPAPNILKLTGIIKEKTELKEKTISTYLRRKIPINGMTYIDIFDLPADKRKALLKDWIAFKQGKV